MKSVIGKLIADNQTTFISGRSILDGVVILNEVIEHAKFTKARRLIFKVNFEKAYDSINWNYLFEMLKYMEFPEKWIKWIKESVSSAMANVLVNGSPSGEFQLTRGLRQRDPLSPFLYLAVAEGFNVLMMKAVREGLIKPSVVGRNKVEISHLQYADDTLFVVEGNVENAKALKWLLKNF